jgi:hypothetical protein
MKNIAAFSALFCILLADPSIAADSRTLAALRYPTSDEAFYVVACMEMNGQNAEGLQKCSCAINAIEAQLPYEQYSEAVLVFAMRQAGGERAAIYRDTVGMKDIADRFVHAQSEANRQCFGRASASATPRSGGTAAHPD